jgi:hypothetical protein
MLSLNALLNQRVETRVKTTEITNKLTFSEQKCVAKKQCKKTSHAFGQKKNIYVQISITENFIHKL